MKLKSYALCTAVFFASLTSFAQEVNMPAPSQTLSLDAETTLLKYQSKLSDLRKKFSKWKYTGDDVLENPYYFQIFSSQTRYDSPLRNTMGSLPSFNEQPSMVCGKVNAIDKYISEHLAEIYTYQPGLISYVEGTDISGGLRHDVNKEIIVDASNVLNEGDKSNAEVVNVEFDESELDVFVKKPNFWTCSANFSLKFTQYYVTDNWYKGGESNNSLLANLVAQANYDDKQKLTFENKLEVKLGFQTTKGSKPKFKTNADLLRLTNKLGLKAAKHWSYTAMLQSWTQMYKAYDGTNVKSDFMSPFESLFSLGMEYKLTKKKFNIKAVLSPAALNFKYVDRDALKSRYGINGKNNFKVDLGSSATIDYNLEICKQVKWKSRIYFFTNYHKMQVDWENTINLKINKYLSTDLFLHPRFDDGVKRDPGEKNIEFNEYISVGFEFNF